MYVCVCVCVCVCVKLLLSNCFLPYQNTFQALLITDGTYSYAIFTYKCGLMEWDNGATIGFNAGGNVYANNDPSSNAVACVNIPSSDWSNILYLLTSASPEEPNPSMLNY